MKFFYFDNSATSSPKPQTVYESVDYTLKNLNTNPGRGGHQLGISCATAIYKVRKKIQKFFNVDNELNIAFTNNSTTALNFAIKGSLASNDVVITSNIEHNSVLRPLFTLKEEINLEVEVLPYKDFIENFILRIENPSLKKPKMLILNHMSNVNGVSFDLEKIGLICNRHKIMFIVDGSQSAGLIPIDMKAMNIDILCFTGHKSLFGIQGTGGICIQNGISLKNIISGGTGSHSTMLSQPQEMPDLLEAGTLNAPGILALGCGIDFIDSIGLAEIKSHEKFLKEEFIKGIKKINENSINSGNEARIILYTSFGENDGPIISLNIKGISSSDLSTYLDEEYNIITRSGLHCAPLLHQELKTDLTGATRFSFGYFNTIDEILYAIDALQKIVIQS
jgi:cysteine desulfurase family protein